MQKKKFRDEEVELLRWIDSSMLQSENKKLAQSSRNLEKLFVQATRRITRRLLLDGKCAFYLNMDTEYVRLGRKSSSDFPLSIAEKASIDWVDVERGPIEKTGETKHFFDEFPGWDYVYIEPLFVFDKELLGFFCVVERKTATGSPILASSDGTKSFRGIFRQLKIAYKFSIENRRTIEICNLWETFSKLGMSPHRCFEALVNHIEDFLPKFDQPKKRKSLHVQILFLREDKLRIRATTGKEKGNVTVGLDNSVCGLAVKTQKTVTIDPTDPRYEGIYQHLIQPSGNVVRTEVAIPIFYQGDVLGIVNIESPEPRAFTIIQVLTMEAIVKSLTPVMVSLEARLKHNRDIQTAYGSVMAEYLDVYGGVFRHEVGAQVSAVDVGLSNLKKILDSPSRDEFIDDSISQIDSASKSFCFVRDSISDHVRDLSSYGTIGLIPLDKIVKKISDDTYRSWTYPGSEKKGPREFVIDYSTLQPSVVKASNLLKPYLMCILDNSIRSIAIKQSRMGFNHMGRIDISVTKIQLAGNKGNTGKNEKIALKIRDNGTGLSAENVRRLRRFEFGTHFRSDSGSGYGLAATQRYLSSIDAWIEIESVYRHNFTVTIYFEEEI